MLFLFIYILINKHSKIFEFVLMNLPIIPPPLLEKITTFNTVSTFYAGPGCVSVKCATSSKFEKKNTSLQFYATARVNCIQIFFNQSFTEAGISMKFAFLPRGDCTKLVLIHVQQSTYFECKYILNLISHFYELFFTQIQLQRILFQQSDKKTNYEDISLRVKNYRKSKYSKNIKIPPNYNKKKNRTVYMHFKFQRSFTLEIVFTVNYQEVIS